MDNSMTYPEAKSPQVPARPEWLFFDGNCGLCHLTVRFLAHQDRNGSAFRFAPLGGETFQRTVPPHLRHDLPDSVLLLTRRGDLLNRSRAVLHALRRLGGAWRLLARVLAVVPRPWADLAYAGIARIRRRLFPPPRESCPRVPPALRTRFDP